MRWSLPHSHDTDGHLGTASGVAISAKLLGSVDLGTDLMIGWQRHLSQPSSPRYNSIRVVRNSFNSKFGMVVVTASEPSIRKNYVWRLGNRTLETDIHRVLVLMMAADTLVF